MNFNFIFIFILQIVHCTLGQVGEYPCDSDIYCHGRILHTLGLSDLTSDRKSLVDSKMLYSKEETYEQFNAMMEMYNDEPPRDMIRFFFRFFFESGNQFEPWSPSDFHQNPRFLQNIQDLNLRSFASEVNAKWLDLGRKVTHDVNQNPDQYSIIWVENGCIVPGGRFTEFFYWDSYWTFKGLILSEMLDTTKGMLENFFQLVDQFGYVPNGGRIYFKRSQPPLLIPMVKLYFDATNDLEFISKNIQFMRTEFEFWEKNRMFTFEGPNGQEYQMLRYSVDIGHPRPENYRLDYTLGTTFMNTEEREEFYKNIKSGAESGWDFSSRWYLPDVDGVIGELRDTKTRNIIPVDLNSFHYWSAVLLAYFEELLGNQTNADLYKEKAEIIKTNINEVFWDSQEGIWFDYIHTLKSHRKVFYPSNLTPLFTQIEPLNMTSFKSYIGQSGAFGYPGGIPTSLIKTEEQWDFPNGWAPLQDLVVVALENSGDPELQELAYEVAQNWVLTTYETYNNPEYNKTMFEKYDVTSRGNPGHGGAYRVVEGFGWTNAVVLDFLNKYGHRMSTNTTTTLPDTDTTSTTSNAPIPTTTDSSNTILPKFHFFALIVTFFITYSSTLL